MYRLSCLTSRIPMQNSIFRRICFSNSMLDRLRHIFRIFSKLLGSMVLPHSLTMKFIVSEWGNNNSEDNALEPNLVSRPNAPNFQNVFAPSIYSGREYKTMFFRLLSTLLKKERKKRRKEINFKKKGGDYTQFLTDQIAITTTKQKNMTVAPPVTT